MTHSFLGLPSPPQTPSYSVQHYGPHNVTVTVQWGYPESDGGAPVDNYTISGSNLMTTTSQVNQTTLTLPYSTSQNIVVAATNCNGTSETTAFTYFECEAIHFLITQVMIVVPSISEWFITTLMPHHILYPIIIAAPFLCW